MTSSDDIPSIYHNPFAGHSESSFTSAISPKRSHADTRPIYRRRGSESLTKRSRNDHDPWIANADWASGISHARSQTADSHFPASTSATSLHPLALGVHISASFSDLPSPSDTRPYLKRAMSDMVSGASGADDVPEATTPASSEGGDEKVVIVHEVSPQDSLAGVALKYGISLADLRRANQLWATDSIHLREVLYIPIESLQNSKQYKVALAESDANASLSREESPESPSTPIPEDEVGTGVGGNLTLRRVPASQLSFFPRPTTSASASNPDVVSTSRTLPKTFQSTSRRPDLSTVFPPSHLSTIPPSSLLPSLFQPSLAHASFLPTRSHLSSLFNALPLAPSTRDTIFSRLSLDSVTSTPTQSSDDQELELDNVGSAACRRERPADGSPAMEINGHSRNDLAGFLPLQGTARSLDAPLELHSFNAPIVCPSRSPTRVRHRTPHHCVSEYTSPEVIDDLREPIRTSQLQPSPSMHLPLIAKRDKVEGS